MKWFTKAAHAPLYEAVIYAFENLPSDSIVLQLLIDAHCRYFYQNADTEENGELERRQQLPKSFLIGVMLKFTAADSNAGVELLHGCDYHGHESEQERQACQNAVFDPGYDPGYDPGICATSHDSASEDSDEE